MTKNKPLTKQTISASEARKNFFQILNQVFEKDDVFVIKKSGIPVAQISKHGSDTNTISKDLYLQNLAATKGAWAESYDPNAQKERHELELQETQKNKKAW